MIDSAGTSPSVHEHVSPTSSIAFGQNASQALDNAQLRNALNGLTNVARSRRLQVLETTNDWEALRTRARAIKDDTLEHLETYLAQFVERAQSVGAVVHRAATAAEANAIVLQLTRDYGVTSVVKSKSMLSEEIHLNDALEHAGIHPVETDLGEWILQLAGETPSHIVVPAIHKTRRDIAALFADRLGTDADASAETLTAAARQELRPAFAQATMGISGVNFGIAETGSILILENEGNARLVTSIPHVHVALMGIEKLIPRLADLDVFLKLLPRAGTGQRLTTYQSLITGVVPDDEEGPRALHIVLVDNGRSSMLADPLTRQALACIRCGACLNACPVYQQVGGHAYDSVYPGPIGAVITPRFMGIAHANQLPYASTLCGACKEVCPVKIDIPALLLKLRGEVIEQDARNDETTGTVFGKRFFERLSFDAWRLAMRSPIMYRLSTSIARLAYRALVATIGTQRAQRFETILPPARAWAQGRELPQLATKSFRDLWNQELREP